MAGCILLQTELNLIVFLPPFLLVPTQGRRREIESNGTDIGFIKPLVFSLHCGHPAHADWKGISTFPGGFSSINLCPNGGRHVNRYETAQKSVERRICIPQTYGLTRVIFVSGRVQIGTMVLGYLPTSTCCHYERSGRYRRKSL